MKPGKTASSPASLTPIRTDELATHTLDSIGGGQCLEGAGGLIEPCYSVARARPPGEQVGRVR